ncbi:hypothetical protein HPB49_000502 [Dermacentor silvarum]|uniref:Uncharacterized protein n=1 Tax=Dermacentor silvarum TaxID=543639 RepID=A0ACB8CCS0_DERSI|nr:hypothetical protein HPB49_000502 [Dermacentor silvarum]
MTTKTQLKPDQRQCEKAGLPSRSWKTIDGAQGATEDGLSARSNEGFGNCKRVRRYYGGNPLASELSKKTQLNNSRCRAWQFNNPLPRDIMNDPTTKRSFKSTRKFALHVLHVFISASEACTRSLQMVRFTVKYRHCDGKLQVKVTDNQVCLQYLTEHSQDVKRIEKLTNLLMRHMASKER